MHALLDLFSHNWPWLVPLSISALLVFVLSRSTALVRRQWQQELETRYLQEGTRHTEEPSAIPQLLEREDVSLRLLEEVYPNPRYRADWGSPDAVRLRSLEGIRSEVRSFLRASLKSDNFPKIKDRVIALLDQIEQETQQPQQKEPFNDIQDPERSLLIDLFAEISPDKKTLKQKALQLASIIKIKHQGILKLQAENAKAAIWTKFGTAGTVVFGVLSIVLSILAVKK